jgi:hypothetical protein
MRSIRILPGAACAALAVLVVLSGTGLASAQGWGTIKGKVVYDGTPPKNQPVTVTADKTHCLSKGEILRNELVVNPKNKGVRWALVWLADVKDFKNPDKVPPIHPSLAKVPEKVEVDQPCCVFEPRMLGMREGTKLIFKNTAPIPHNILMTGGPLGPNGNPLVPSGRSHEESAVKARFLPWSYSCSIHGWMKGWVGVFKHPYFAVTDADGNFEIKNAPAGKWRLLLWQEKVGFVVQKSPQDRGIVIEVKDKSTTTIKDVKLKDSDD